MSQVNFSFSNELKYPVGCRADPRQSLTQHSIKDLEGHRHFQRRVQGPPGTHILKCWVNRKVAPSDAFLVESRLGKEGNKSFSVRELSCKQYLQIRLFSLCGFGRKPQKDV